MNLCSAPPKLAINYSMLWRLGISCKYSKELAQKIRNMLIILSVIAFFYAYLSFQDNEIISFYIALSGGILFIGAMVNNVIQIKKMESKK